MASSKRVRLTEMSFFKFGIPAGEGLVPFAYQPSYRHEITSGVSRLVIAPASEHIELLLKLSNLLPEPFGILYVLIVPHLDSAPARYQCPKPLSRSEMEAFLTEFHEFFEGDGRHHLWIASLPQKATLVYDRHDLIYAYGPLQQFATVLEEQGLKQGAISVPSPHAHRYHSEFDSSQAKVLSHWAWKTTPLMEQDLQ